MPGYYLEAAPAWFRMATVLNGMSEPTPVTLVLVDDNLGFQTALVAHLGSAGNFSLLAVARSGREALEFALTPDPDIVLLDMHLPDYFGLGLIKPLLQKWPRAKIIVLTFDDYPRLRQRALAAGAVDFVSKMDAAHQIVTAIRKALRAANGETPWQAETGASSGC